VLNLRCNKCSVYIEGSTILHRKGGTHFETRISIDENKQKKRKNILIMDLKENEARNDCDGEGLEQFNWPTDCFQADCKVKIYLEPRIKCKKNFEIYYQTSTHEAIDNSVRAILICEEYESAVWPRRPRIWP
jgi:hypothetical protein